MTIKKWFMGFCALGLWIGLIVGLTAPGMYGFPASAQAAAVLQPRLGEYRPGDIIVRFRPGLEADTANGLMSSYGAVYVQSAPDSSFQLWQVAAGDELAVIEQLNADARVLYAEPNYVVRLSLTPTDPGYPNQWAHDIIQSPAAWDITTGAASVIIAVIDTGIDANHPELAGRVVAGYDYWDGDTDPRDMNGHGTHVSGIIAAAGNNGAGGAGLAWGGRIMPVRVLNEQGQGYTWAVVSGIFFAYQNGARVINLSLGGETYSQSMQDAITGAHNAGALVVAAMGNSNTGDTMYPAGMNYVLAVSATDRYDSRSLYSNYGNHCDVAAPGGMMSYLHHSNGIYSTMPTYAVYLNNDGYYQNYDYLHGTSQAAPFVAGLAALIWSVDPALTADEVQNVIQSTAVDLGAAGHDIYYGWGRINAQAALQLVAPLSAPLLPEIVNPGGYGFYLIDWSDVPAASSYTLEEDDNRQFNSPGIRYTGSASQLQVNGQFPGGVYYYRVRANSGGRTSPWSETRLVKVLPETPNLRYIYNPTQKDAYIVDWDVAFGATGYWLQESADSAFTTPTTRYVGSGLEIQITGQPGGGWYYRVRSYSLAGYSAWSDPIASTTVASPTLDAPTLLEVNNADGDNDYVLDWTDVTSATVYTLEQSTDLFFSAPTHVYSGTLTQFAVADQPLGDWHYRVRAGSPAGQGPWSNAQLVALIKKIFLAMVSK